MSITKSLPLLMLLFTGCVRQNPPSVNRFLNTNRLPVEVFSIDISRDTVLITSNATRISIPAGALKSNSSRVSLEIKEAITPEQILAAGMVTESNEKLLSSGGMVSINPLKGEDATIVKPIIASIPVGRPVKGMMAFKGEETKNGINWKDPQPLFLPKDTMQEAGKAIFNINCASCHNPLKDATGPALYGAQARWGSGDAGKKDMYQFVRNPAAIIASGHRYANCLFDKWNRTAMTSFSDLSDRDIDAIFYYVEKEGNMRLGKDAVKVLSYSKDSCERQKRRLLELYGALEELDVKRKPFVVLNNQSPLLNPPTSFDKADTIDKKKLVSKEAYAGDYYNIEIRTFGWYNIDILVSDLNDIQESTLEVRLQGTYSSKMKVLLVIPSHKIMSDGGLLDDGKSYGFYEANGKLALPQGVMAYILGISEEQDKYQLYFGHTVFTTSLQQTIDVVMQKSDSAQFSAYINGLHFQQMEMRVLQDTTVVELRTVQSKINELNILLHDRCSCYMEDKKESDYLVK